MFAIIYLDIKYRRVCFGNGKDDKLRLRCLWGIKTGISRKQDKV